MASTPAPFKMVALGMAQAGLRCRQGRLWRARLNLLPPRESFLD
ncbi:hypothetical protein ACFXKR_35890 [Streptomyces violascens]